jgi:alkylation response protein AidB-like acyl-CoA dehydrogenase
MKSPYTELNFGLGETLDSLREQINRFAAAEIAPRAEEIDRSNEFPMDLWQKWVTWVCWASLSANNTAAPAWATWPT